MRVLAAAGAVALVSIVTFGVMLDALREQNNVAGAGRATTEALFAGARLQRLALDLETGVGGFMLTRDESFLVPYNDAVRQLPAAARALTRVPNDPSQRARIAAL